MAEKKYIEVEKLPKRKEYWDDDFGAGWDACLDAIDSIPTADVRPVVMGKWLHKEITDDFRVVGQCSVCKERRRIDNFCPNCGADMREEQT